MRLIIVRHGETDWTLSGCYTGIAGVGLTANGRREATELAPLLDRVLNVQSSAKPNLGCRYVIVGHSERRRFLGETGDMIARKLQTAFAHRPTPILSPILCVGDTREDHQAGRSDAVVQAQLGVLLGVYPASGAPFVVADELRAQLAADTTLLYGGSLTASDAESYLTQTDIDGGLVGAASQHLNSFHALINATVATCCRSTPAPTQANPGRGEKGTSYGHRISRVPSQALEVPTTAKPFHTSGDNYTKQLNRHVKKPSSLQRLYYASDHWALDATAVATAGPAMGHRPPTARRTSSASSDSRRSSCSSKSWACTVTCRRAS